MFLERNFYRIALIGLVGLWLLRLVLSDFQQSLVSEMLIAGLFAMSLNLILGYGGMVSFGHALYYGIGAYTVGIATTRFQIDPVLAMLVAPFISALVALILGWFCVRSVQLYFSILTLAFGQLVYIVVLRGGEFTGGDNGITGIPAPFFLQNEAQFYLFTATIFILSVLLMYHLSKSPFMLILKTIRENPERATFIGVNVRRHQLIVMVISAFFAGVAGSLIAQHHQLVALDMLNWTTSAEPLLASLLGGMYSLIGPALGGGLLVFLEVTITRFTPFWAFILGLLTIILVLLAPDGFVGFWQRLSKRGGTSSEQ